MVFKEKKCLRKPKIKCVKLFEKKHVSKKNVALENLVIETKHLRILEGTDTLDITSVWSMFVI